MAKDKITLLQGEYTITEQCTMYYHRTILCSMYVITYYLFLYPRSKE